MIENPEPIEVDPLMLLLFDTDPLIPADRDETLEYIEDKFRREKRMREIRSMDIEGWVEAQL